MHETTIGGSRRAIVGFELSDLDLVPDRRTRSPALIDVSWTLDAYSFALPILGAPLDAVTSPETARILGELGALGVLNLEGLWTRYREPQEVLARIAELPRDGSAIPVLQRLYAQPVDEDLIGQRVEELRRSGLAAGCLRPGKVERHHHTALEAGLDLLLVHGVTVTAQHVTRSGDEPLDLRDFTARYDIPVIVGGVSSAKSALHLMRTGAVGVLVGNEAASVSTARRALGVHVPLATAIAEVASARSRYLEESGRYVQVIVAGGIETGGDIARAIACGADAVMLGRTLASATEAPAQGAYWGPSASHQELPRSRFDRLERLGSLSRILHGPADREDGRVNLVGALRRSMGITGSESLAALRATTLSVTRR